MSDSLNPIRAWRLAHDLSLEEACALFIERGYRPPSTAKLSRIERGQAVPVEMLGVLSALTGISARVLRPDLAALFDAEAA